MAPEARHGGGAARAACLHTLPQVSRTFALVIRLLPPSLSYPVAISYLICRMADTIEDHPGLPRETRRALLAELRGALLDRAAAVPNILGATFGGAEQALMQMSPVVLGEFHALPATQVAAVTPWILEMIDGMAESLPPDDRGLAPLFETMDGLRRYCYFVAGTVGRLLTALFTDRYPPASVAVRDRLIELSPRFGLVLQLTNVIRDVATDARQGRNHLPAELWQRASISSEELFRPGYEQESWQLVDPLLSEAKANMASAIDYITLLPRRALRVRLFCLAPLLHAARTLAAIQARRDTLGPGPTIKISRRSIYGLTLLAAVVAPSNSAIRLVFRGMR